MQIKLKKTAEDWSRLSNELTILQAGSESMYLQYLCDLVLRGIKPTHEAYQAKRTELIKKYGSADEANPEVFKVEQFEPKKDTDAPDAIPEETENWKKFTEELTPIKNHESELTLECLEAELFRSQNPKNFTKMFMEYGISVGVYRFNLIYDITDKTAVAENQ